MEAQVIPGIFCDSCKAVHLNPSPRDLALAKVWGFFVCGMAEKPHCDETFIRQVVVIDNIRVNLFTGEPDDAEDHLIEDAV